MLLAICTLGRQVGLAACKLGYFRGFSYKSGPCAPRKQFNSQEDSPIYTRVKAWTPACQCLCVSLPKGTHTSEQSLREVLEPLPCHCQL